MADAKEVLEMMKGMAQNRIEMLREGITFHDSYKKAFYLQAYEEKVREIENMIRRLNFRVVHGGKGKPEQ